MKEKINSEVIEKSKNIDFMDEKYGDRIKETTGREKQCTLLFVSTQGEIPARPSFLVS